MQKPQTRFSFAVLSWEIELQQSSILELYNQRASRNSYVPKFPIFSTGEVFFSCLPAVFLEGQAL